jgi:hypothetical protein
MPWWRSQWAVCIVSCALTASWTSVYINSRDPSQMHSHITCCSHHAHDISQTPHYQRMQVKCPFPACATNLSKTHRIEYQLVYAGDYHWRTRKTASCSCVNTFSFRARILPSSKPCQFIPVRFVLVRRPPQRARIRRPPCQLATLRIPIAASRKTTARFAQSRSRDASCHHLVTCARRKSISRNIYCNGAK